MADTIEKELKELKKYLADELFKKDWILQHVVNDKLNVIIGKYKLELSGGKKPDASKNTLPIGVVTKRTFECAKCGKTYLLTIGIAHAGCCTAWCEYRTTKICGGKLLEVFD
jgi:hypothetical protein